MTEPGEPLWLTASRRLARLRREAYARAARTQGRWAWESPSIHPFEAWVLEAAGEDGDAPPLLAAPAARALWTRVVRTAGAAGDPAPLATLASEAWRLLHLHGIGLEELEREGGEDSERFLGLAHAYARALETLGVEDAPRRLARAPARLRRRASGGLPGIVWRVGFLDPAPAEKEVFAALGEAGVAIRDEPDPPSATPGVVVVADLEDEWRAAGRWFHERLRARPEGLFALVVPELGEHRLRLERILEDVLEPEGTLAPARTRRRCNLAGGTPLADEPVVAAARLLVRLALTGLEPTGWSALLLSPYWGTGLSGGRWRDELVLRRLSPLRVFSAASLPRVGLDPGGDLLDRLERVRGHAALRPEPRPLASWIGELRGWLAAWGWPGPGLDSPAHQARRAHEELLDALLGASAVLGRSVTADDFLFHYEDTLAARLFQPEVRGAGVLVLEPRDVLGLRLDGLWVAGLHAEAWPPPAEIHPFLPVALARRHRLPRCDVPEALAEARRVERAWRFAAPEIVYSRAVRERDLVLRPSPLLAGLPAVTPPPAGPDGGLRGDLFARRSTILRREIPASDPAPPLGPRLASGSRLLKEQTLCPFRGFALRLRADPVPPFALPLDPRWHGKLLHEALQRLAVEAGGWEAGTKDRLLRRLPSVVAEILRAEAAEDALGPGFVRVETRRLERLLARWLVLEEGIGGPRRWEAEVPASCTGEGLEFELRSDRIDRGEDGRGVVLDFKTTRGASRASFDPSGDDPQLRLYALAQRDVSAVGYIVFEGETTEIKTRFLGAPGTAWAGVAGYTAEADWEDLLARWRAEVTRLLADIRAGSAVLAPRKGEATCRDCPYPVLCRRNSLLPAGFTPEEDAP